MEVKESHSRVSWWRTLENKKKKTHTNKPEEEKEETRHGGLLDRELSNVWNKFVAESEVLYSPPPHTRTQTLSLSLSLVKGVEVNIIKTGLYTTEEKCFPLPSKV